MYKIAEWTSTATLVIQMHDTFLQYSNLKKWKHQKNLYSSIITWTWRTRIDWMNAQVSSQWRKPTTTRRLEGDNAHTQDKGPWGWTALCSLNSTVQHSGGQDKYDDDTPCHDVIDRRDDTSRGRWIHESTVGEIDRDNAGSQLYYTLRRRRSINHLSATWRILLTSPQLIPSLIPPTTSYLCGRQWRTIGGERGGAHLDM